MDDNISKPSTNANDTSRSYTISGVEVHFPYKAYPSQLSMMSKIIQALQQRKHCLLESPTGSGKSLALLCAALAWQAKEYEIARREQLQIEQDLQKALASLQEDPPSANINIPDATQHQLIGKDVSNEVSLTENETTAAVPVASKSNSDNWRKGKIIKSESGRNTDEDDFQPDRKRFRPPMKSNKKGKKNRNSTGNNDQTISSDANQLSIKGMLLQGIRSIPASDEQSSVDRGPRSQLEPSSSTSQSSIHIPISSKHNISVPKIYFGTRTHKQITQIIRELRKTAYKNVDMTVLSSRDYTCIHPKVSKSMYKNEDCRNTIEVGCTYHHNTARLKNHQALRARGITTAWDIEDIVRVGCQSKACPYYAARGLMDASDIVFCPYNYLIEPMIRDQMEIVPNNQIIILDEAHNIEDCSRDATSFEITLLTLKDMIDDLNDLIERNVLTADHGPLQAMCYKLWIWITSESDTLRNTGFEQATKVWSAAEILAIFKPMGISLDTYSTLKNHVDKVTEHERAEYANKIETGIVQAASGKTLLNLKSFIVILGYLLREDMKYCTDYKMAIVKSVVSVPVETVQGRRRWRTGQKRKQWTFSLNFWCMNPAVAFNDIGPPAHSIILASGTLSPMESFSSELGLPFSVRLEAAHIISNGQALVATLSNGTNGVSLNAAYRSAETYAFQDELGSMILGACKVVPHGILCFLPSYNLLDKIITRWQNTGLWNALTALKTVIVEPRSGSKAEFDDLLQTFYMAVSDSSEQLDAKSGPSGGLFLAVCRGKVSEGLDFADNNARAVITVGIPYPNVKDLKIELKRKYNDEFSLQRGLLSGKEWYDIQAYRALNQALGRCIRNRNDWGALLLLDDRFGKSKKYTEGLAKWIRHQIRHYNNASDMLSTLSLFVTTRSDGSGSSSSLSQGSASQSCTPVKVTQPSPPTNETTSPVLVDMTSPVGKPKLSLCTQFITAKRLFDQTESTKCLSEIPVVAQSSSAQSFLATNAVCLTTCDSNANGNNLELIDEQPMETTVDDEILNETVDSQASLISYTSSPNSNKVSELEKSDDIDEFTDSESELDNTILQVDENNARELFNNTQVYHKRCCICDSRLLAYSDHQGSFKMCTCELYYFEAVKEIYDKFLLSIGRRHAKFENLSMNAYMCKKENLGPDCSTVSHTITNSGKEWLNSYYSSNDGKVYVPIQCVKCNRNHLSTDCWPIVGVMEITIGTGENQVYMLREAVQD